MAVNALGLEDYVRGVVARESPSTWPAEALKAQAVAARTYAIATAKPGAAFDQYADVRSQVYGGVGAETTATDAAVAATRDQVVTYAGRPAVTYFFSTSGGRTENVENSFLGSAPKPWLRSVADPYDGVSPRHRWGPFRLTAVQAQSRLRGLLEGRYKTLRVTRRGVSPRIVSATLVGTRGTTVVSGPTLRRVFGLDDTWAYFTTVRTGVRKPKKAPRPTPATGGSGGVVVDPGSAVSGGTAPGAARAAAVGLRAAVLHGAVLPGRRGAWVRLQRRAGARWVLAADVRLGRGGTYAVTAPQPGTYRVLAANAAGPTVRVG
jgi:stage II sporulation protein D